MSEVRLSMRAAVALFVLPQALTLAALTALFLEGQDRAAPFRERRQAQAESIPILHTTSPSATNPSPASAAAPQPAAPISMQRLLERVLAPAAASTPQIERPTLPKLPSESREDLGTRLRAEIEDGFATLEAAELPDWATNRNSDRLEEIRGLIADLQALQASFAGLRGGGGAGGGLGGAGGALSQIMPLLDALQTLREGRLGQDSTSLEILDDYLGRDQERPRHLALLVLLAWALEGATADT